MLVGSSQGVLLLVMAYVAHLGADYSLVVDLHLLLAHLIVICMLHLLALVVDYPLIVGEGLGLGHLLTSTSHRTIKIVLFILLLLL